MKWLRIVIAVIFVGVLVYYYLHPLPDSVHHAAATILPVSKHEEEVRGVFASYTELLTRGDPQSEAVYLPDAKFLLVVTDPQGKRHQKSMTAAQHRVTTQQILPQIKAGQIRLRFADVECRELPDGKVRLSCTTYLNDGPPERISMVFVSTAPGRWAVSEETHRL
jgi:hypothetical protein